MIRSYWELKKAIFIVVTYKIATTSQNFYNPATKTTFTVYVTNSKITVKYKFLLQLEMTVLLKFMTSIQDS